MDEDGNFVDFSDVTVGDDTIDLDDMNDTIEMSIIKEEDNENDE